MKTAYQSHIKSREWQDTRRKAIIRDGGMCVRCGSMRDLQGHHTTYERLGREALGDIETLCKRCHKLQHNR